MSASLARRWFDFHPLTPVLLALATVAMLAANVLFRPLWPVNTNEMQRNCMRGFPCAAYSFIPDDLPENDYGDSGGGVSGWFEAAPHFRISGIIFNASVALVAMAAIGLASEFLIRHFKRRPWQIRLSTAVLIMIAASAYVCVNTRRWSWHPPSQFPGIDYPYSKWFGYGWPCIFCQSELVEWTDLNAHTVENWHVRPLNLGIDILVLVIGSIAVARAFEFLIRRREAYRP